MTHPQLPMTKHQPRITTTFSPFLCISIGP
jgi:hypothetical protein